MMMTRDDFFARLLSVEAIGVIKLAIEAGVSIEKFESLSIPFNSYNMDYESVDTLNIFLREIFTISEQLSSGDAEEFEEVQHWVAQVAGLEVKLNTDYLCLVIMDDVFNDFGLPSFKSYESENMYSYSDNEFDAYKIDGGYLILADLNYGYPNILGFAEKLIEVYKQAAGRKQQ